MAGRKPVHNLDGVGAVGGEQHLVAGEKPPVGLEIREIVLVEFVWSRRIQVDPVVVAACRTCLDQDLPVGCL